MITLKLPWYGMNLTANKVEVMKSMVKELRIKDLLILEEQITHCPYHNKI